MNSEELGFRETDIIRKYKYLKFYLLSKRFFYMHSFTKDYAENSMLFEGMLPAFRIFC